MIYLMWRVCKAIIPERGVVVGDPLIYEVEPDVITSLGLSGGQSQSPYV